MSQKISLTVNGNKYELVIEGHETLADVLRNELGLTGTKIGCGEGECGACTVLVDGETVTSCIMLAAQADGSKVTTIEGLTARSEDELHPVQKAFVEAGAIQCGFCTPGFVMSTVNLLERNPDPSEAEIREGLAGNLCRCTGYQQIFEAVELAREKLEV